MEGVTVDYNATSLKRYYKKASNRVGTLTWFISESSDMNLKGLSRNQGKFKDNEGFKKATFAERYRGT